MVRIPLSALVVSSAAILLATSVTPPERAVVPPTPELTGGSAVTSAGSAMPLAKTRPATADAGGRVAGAAMGQRSAARATVAEGGGAAPVAGAARPSTSADVRARWRWPALPRPPVVRPFRAPVTTYGAGHRGLDLAVADGTPVLAVEDGVVTHAGLVAGRGTVTVAHRGGLSSTYEPVDATVAVGAVVVTGQVIGTLRARAGPAHCGVRVCLHLGARRGATYLDPHPLLAGGRVALLPLGE